MSVSADIDLTRAVRRIFVRHWVDLGRLSVRCMSGRVYLNGRLQRIPGKEGELQAQIVDAMFHELSRVPGVKTINARFENWINDTGKWRSFERHDTKDAFK